MLVHLDTDIGSDPDDACALAMLLGWPDAELVGVTTSTDPDGRRAGCVRYLLDLMGREDVPAVAGAGLAPAAGGRVRPVADQRRHWPNGVSPRPARPGEAVELLRDSVSRGAVVVAIGPYSNLALLQRSAPGALAGVPVVLMGGWIDPPGPGLPAWGPERDYNVQADPGAAREVFEAAADLTLSTLTAGLRVPLRRRHLEALRGLGEVGQLLARQSELHGEESGKPALGPAHSRLPDDLVNFHHDPLACAAALGWPGAVVERMPLRPVRDGDALRWVRDDGGRPVRVVVDADGEAFGRVWLQAVERAAT